MKRAAAGLSVSARATEYKGVTYTLRRIGIPTEHPLNRERFAGSLGLHTADDPAGPDESNDIASTATRRCTRSSVRSRTLNTKSTARDEDRPQQCIAQCYLRTGHYRRSALASDSLERFSAGVSAARTGRIGIVLIGLPEFVPLVKRTVLAERFTDAPQPLRKRCQGTGPKSKRGRQRQHK